MKGLTLIDLANVGTGKGFKKAVGVSGKILGIGSIVKSVPNEDGEITDKSIAIVKVSGDGKTEVFSGASIVMNARVAELEGIFDSDPTAFENGRITGHFETIDCKEGEGVTLILDTYDEPGK